MESCRSSKIYSQCHRQKRSKVSEYRRAVLRAIRPPTALEPTSATRSMIAPSPLSAKSLQRCFVSLEDIPPEYRTAKCLQEKNYLLDGKICSWEGTLAEVSSP